MFIIKKNKILTLIFLLLLSYSYAFAFSSTKINIIFASTMFDITDYKYGNYSKLATLLENERANNQHTIFLFGGDSLGPSSMSSLDKGVHIIDILNFLEPDTVAVNKRELIFGADELTLRSFEAAFPFVASNLYDTLTRGNIDGILDNTIILKNNFKIGIISVIDLSVIEEYSLHRVSILDLENSIKKQAAYLRSQNVPFIVLLPSNIFSFTQKLLDEGIINLSLDENVHLKLDKREKPKDIRNVLITQKGTVSKVSLSYDTKNNKVLDIKNKLLFLKDYQENNIILKKINNYKDKLDLLFEEKIGIFLNSVNTKREVVRKKESIFGNLLADAVKDYTGAQVAIINGGSIRGETLYTKNHAITRKDIVKELPFRSKVKLLEVNGKQILDAIENGLSLLENTKGRFLHFSGINIIFNPNAKVGQRVKSIFIQGKKLNINESYKLATSDYIASGGDGYTMFLDSQSLQYSNLKQRLISNILIDYIIKRRLIRTQLEGRIKEVSNEK
jgi:2',3'-cyclic-nucleotide 2'-phosphodiesterase (5'-nucleotidase family)